MFYVTDLIHRDECMVKYCPTEDMIADYNTKPLVGNKFKVFRDLIMNLSGIIPRVGQQEYIIKIINDQKCPSSTSKTKIKTRKIRVRAILFRFLIASAECQRSSVERRN